MSHPPITADGELVAFPQATVYLRVVGEGQPLLLINGLGAHTGMWRPLERHLDGFRIVEFDLPGAGRSPVPRQAVGVAQLAELALAVMDHAGLETPDVLGYSMGGMVAQHLAARHPARVRRLILAATTPGVGAMQGDPRALVNIVTPARYLSKALYARSIGSMVGGRARHDREFVAQQARVRLEHRPTFRGYAMQLRSLARWSSLPHLAKITSPTLVIAGGDDPLTPAANAKMIAHAVPDARAVIVRDQGHLLMVDERSTALPAVRDFFAAKRLEDSAVWQNAEVVDAESVRRAIASAPRQLPPRSLRDARARRRWLHLDAELVA